MAMGWMSSLTEMSPTMPCVPGELAATCVDAAATAGDERDARPARRELADQREAQPGRAAGDRDPPSVEWIVHGRLPDVS